MTTADVIEAPLSRPVQEFPAICGHCGGPLVLLPGRVVRAYVHARHADWQAAPHTAEPL